MTFSSQCLKMKQYQTQQKFFLKKKEETEDTR